MTDVASKSTQGKDKLEELSTPEVQFLLSEYSRLADYQRLTVESYNRWFASYLTIASGAIVVLVPLLQALAPQYHDNVTNVVLGSLAILGLVVFVGLSSSNAACIQYERAIHLLQDYFFQRYPELQDFLFFRKRRVGIKGVGIIALLIRGVTGGSPKSLILLANSVFGSSFVLRIMLESKLPFDSNIVLSAASVFLVLALAQVLYTRIIYRAHGI